MKRKLIGAALAALLTSCQSDYISQAAHRQCVFEQLNASEVCAVPGIYYKFIAKIHGQVWFVETTNKDRKPVILASTLVFKRVAE